MSLCIDGARDERDKWARLSPRKCGELDRWRVSAARGWHIELWHYGAVIPMKLSPLSTSVYTDSVAQILPLNPFTHGRLVSGRRNGSCPTPWLKRPLHVLIAAMVAEVSWSLNKSLKSGRSTFVACAAVNALMRSFSLTGRGLLSGVSANRSLLPRGT